MVHTAVLPANVADSIVASALSACGNFCNTGLTLNSAFASIANTLTFLLGAVSVMMIIIAGFRFTTSNGNAKSVAEARLTILYAVTGVVVAISAFAIVQFVIAAIN